MSWPSETPNAECVHGKTAGSAPTWRLTALALVAARPGQVVRCAELLILFSQILQLHLHGSNVGRVGPRRCTAPIFNNVDIDLEANEVAQHRGE